MDIQQMIALLIAGVAFLYVGRYVAGEIRNLVSSRSGCASGCGKCEYANNGKAAKQKPNSVAIVHLSEIKPVSARTPVDEFLNRREASQ